MWRTIYRRFLDLGSPYSGRRCLSIPFESLLFPGKFSQSRNDSWVTAVEAFLIAGEQTHLPLVFDCQSAVSIKLQFVFPRLSAGEVRDEPAFHWLDKCGCHTRCLSVRGDVQAKAFSTGLPINAFLIPTNESMSCLGAKGVGVWTVKLSGVILMPSLDPSTAMSQ